MSQTQLLQTIFDGENIYSTNQIFNDKIDIAESARLLVITSNSLDPAEQSQFDKIIAACGLLPEEVFHSSSPISWASVNQYSNIETVLLFGVLPKELGINIALPLNEPINFDEKTWIQTLNLKELSVNVQAKTALWQQALKPKFQH